MQPRKRSSQEAELDDSNLLDDATSPMKNSTSDADMSETDLGAKKSLDFNSEMPPLNSADGSSGAADATPIVPPSPWIH